MVLRAQSGNVTLTAILGLFFLGLVGGIFYAFNDRGPSEQEKTSLEARAAYDEAVRKLEQALSNPASAEASMARNAGFQCLFGNDGVCRGQGGLFLLFETAQAQRPLSHLALDTGSDSLGSPCKNYPSKECPLRVETVWEPICAGDRCENTKSFKVKAKITLSPMIGPEAPLVWTKEVLFSPQIQLSKGASCARGGGEWTGVECLTPSQAAERRIASSRGAVPTENRDSARVENPLPSEAPAPVPQVVYECPNQIVVQGQFYPVQFLAADRGQVSVPAMSCHIAGAFDMFVFQCVAKNPAAFPNEGQWIQVEAAMAPACDDAGTPVTNLPIRF